MKCLLNNTEVSYPCSPNCALFGDCVTAFQKARAMTNADRIRAMSDDGLAEMLVVWLDDWCEYECPDGQRFLKQDKAIAHTLEWLKRPAQEI